MASLLTYRQQISKPPLQNYKFYKKNIRKNDNL